MASFAFGPFVLDDVSRTLERDGLPVPLTGKVYDLIACLVRAQGKVVSKTALVDQVWQQRSISDTTIAQHVYLARKALHDLRGPHQYIRTVHCVGYRISTEVRTLEERAAAPMHGSSSQFTALELLSSAYYFRRAGTPAALNSCIELCAKAALFDSSLAAAHGTAALTEIFQALYAYKPAASAYGSARRLAHSALEIDPQSALGHTALAAVLLFAEGDALGALEHLARAAQQRTDLREAHLLQVCALVAQDRVDSAQRAARQGARSMPESSVVPLYYAFALYHGNELDAAARKLRLLLELYPRLAFGRLLLGFVELSRENYRSARDLFEQLLTFDAAQPGAYEKYHVFARAGLGHVLARTVGLDTGHDFGKLGLPVFAHYPRAIVFAGMREWAAAAAEISLSVSQAEPWAVFARTDPMFRALPRAS